MGLLDGFPPGGWRGLLNAPIDQVPWQKPAPLFVPLTDTAHNAGGDPNQPAAIASPAASTMPTAINDAGRGQPAGTDGGAQPPQWPAPNLTMRALRIKGVPEAHIAAAFDDPALMRQLINRNFGPTSIGANALSNPIRIGGDSCNLSKGPKTLEEWYEWVARGGV
jgi:hypothetical protein